MKISLGFLVLAFSFLLPAHGFAKPYSLRVKKISSEKNLKDYIKPLEESFYSELNLQSDLHLEEENFDGSIVVNLKAMSYSLELGQAELLAEVELLSAQGEQFFEGEFWGSSGSKLGYKGSLQSLMKESASQLGEKIVKNISKILQNPGKVTVDDRNEEIWFLGDGLNYHEGETVSVLRKNRLVARAKVEKVNGGTVVSSLLEKFEAIKNGDDVFLGKWIETESPIATDVHNFKRKKKSKIGYVLGLLGVGAVALALASGNNEKNDPAITSNTPVNVTVGIVNGTLGLAPNTGAVAGNRTATIVATPLNSSNQEISSNISWQATAGIVTPSSGNSRQAIFTPPPTPQIVAITAQAGNATGTTTIHVGSDPVLAFETAGRTRVPLNVSESVRISFKLYSGAIDPLTGQRIMAPGNYPLTASILRRDTFAPPTSSFLKSVDSAGLLGTTQGTSIQVSSQNSSNVEVQVTRGAQESDVDLVLEFKTLNGISLTFSGAGTQFFIEDP